MNNITIINEFIDDNIYNNNTNDNNGDMKQISEQKVRSIVRQVMREALEEDYPFSYLGAESCDTNTNSEVMANVPYDSPDVNPEPTDADKIEKSLSNSSWWNRHYGFNGYAL